jgi:murein DD-endopeptidase MepM/ murein hydrolase activator NlpD
MGLGKRRAGLLLGCWAALGCSGSGRRADQPLHSQHLPGAWHIVAQGETPTTIAREAGIPLEDFLEINGLRKNDALEPGRPVFVLAPSAAPSGSASLSPENATPAPGSAVPPGGTVSNAPLRWPVAAPRLSSLFGKRWGKDHEGIDMAAPTGTPVYAAASGTVIYSGDQVRGYGNMVVIRHENGLVTVYAHNSLLLVHAGDVVAVGREIARVGDTGRSTAPHLHFEVRRGDTPQDPMQFLPGLK